MYLHNTGPFRGFSSKPLGPLLKDGLPLMKILKTLAKSVLIPLELTAAGSATFIRKLFGSC